MAAEGEGSVEPSDGEAGSFAEGGAPADAAFDPGAAGQGAASLPDETDELPPLDDLVQRIPAPTRALIDELFRAKFVTVKRLPRSAFKS